jgi:short-subunit dehydrogenase
MFAESLRAEVREHGITVTALLPGATDSDFHARAGLGDTKFGDNSWKNDKRLVTRQGVDALFADKDAVVGGDRATKFAVLRNRLLPERDKQPDTPARRRCCVGDEDECLLAINNPWGWASS